MHAITTLRLRGLTRAWCQACFRVWPPGLH